MAGAYFVFEFVGYILLVFFLLAFLGSLAFAVLTLIYKARGQSWRSAFYPARQSAASLIKRVAPYF